MTWRQERGQRSALQPSFRHGTSEPGAGLRFQGKEEDGAGLFSKVAAGGPRKPRNSVSKSVGDQTQGLLPQAEQAYRDILIERPNFWPAYNNLGVILSREAKYDEAAKAFAAAGAAAPKVAQPMANLAQTYLNWEGATMPAQH